MPSHVLIVSGLPAAGKTTLAEALATQLALPLVTKDDYKATLLRHLPALTNAEAGPLSFSLMWQVAETLLRAGQDFILETHFHRPQSEDIIQTLASTYGAAVSQIFCFAPLPELQRRHDARVAGGQRPRIDLPFDYARLPPHWGHEPLDLGEAVPLLRLDTTQTGTAAQATAWVQNLVLSRQ